MHLRADMARCTKSQNSTLGCQISLPSVKGIAYSFVPLLLFSISTAQKQARRKAVSIFFALTSQIQRKGRYIVGSHGRSVDQSLN